MIKLYLDVSGVILANKHTEYANCGSHIEFRNFLSSGVPFEKDIAEKCFKN